MHSFPAVSMDPELGRCVKIWNKAVQLIFVGAVMAVKKTLLLVVLLSALVSVAAAQSSPAAWSARSLFVGAAPSTLNPDWGCQSGSPVSCWDRQLFGVGAYAGVNQLWKQFGVEADARFFSSRGGALNGLKEYSYVGGPSYRLLGRRNVAVFANALVGLGSITIPKGLGPGQGTYFIYSPSAHIDQRLTHNLNIRYEYEYQLWPGFTGLKGGHGITPNGFGVGVTYTLHPGMGRY